MRDAEREARHAMYVARHEERQGSTYLAGKKRRRDRACPRGGERRGRLRRSVATGEDGSPG